MDAPGDLLVVERGHIVQRGGLGQAAANRPAVVGGGGEQVQLHAFAGQGLDQRDDQQAGGVLVEAVGDKADLDRRVRCRLCVDQIETLAQGGGFPLNRCGIRRGRMLLHSRADIFREHDEGADDDVRFDDAQQALTERVQSAPIA